jgi:hypothetical protein
VNISTSKQSKNNKGVAPHQRPEQQRKKEYKQKKNILTA